MAIKGGNRSTPQLDLLLPPRKRYPFHRALRDASFFTSIDPSDWSTKTGGFRRWKHFQIAFMVSLCLRLFVECLVPTSSPLLLYLGDFKGTIQTLLLISLIFIFFSIFLPTSLVGWTVPDKSGDLDRGGHRRAFLLLHQPANFLRQRRPLGAAVSVCRGPAHRPADQTWRWTADGESAL